MPTDYFEPFALMERTQSPDGLGGTDATWRDSLIFQGGVTFVPGGETTVAGLTALRTVPVLAHEYDVILRQDDLVRRLSDGAVYRVDGPSEQTSVPCGVDMRFAFACVTRLKQTEVDV